MNSGVSMLASPTNGVSEFGPKPFLAAPDEAPVERDADDVHGLAVADQRLDALGHDGLGLHRAALRPHPHPAALDLMPFSFASSSEISTKNSGCSIAFTRTCLVQKWKCSVSR